MLSIYIVNLLGGMFFSWVFLLTSFSSIRHRYKIDNLSATLKDLEYSANRKSYETIKINNHTHFVFKKAVPDDIYGKDDRYSQENQTEEDENEIHKMRNLFHKLAILNQLSTPGNPQIKLDIIRREQLEIYGNVEIRGVNIEKWLEGFEEFMNPNTEEF